MSHLTDDPLQFKFQWIDDNGNATGFFRKRGSFDGEMLLLDDVEIPAGVITQVEVRDTRMVFAVLTESGEPAVLAVNLTQRAAQTLKAEIDVSRSATWAEFHKQRLEEKGRLAAFREEECPICEATLVLTDMPETPQLYCQFCNSLSTVDAMTDPTVGERDLRICDECDMFSKPRKFTVFYFVFLVVFYYVSQRTTWRCPACMRGDAWKMLFGNLPFLIGVPVAMVQLVRSYGGSIAGGPFQGLDAANLKGRRGDLIGALEGYRDILDRVPHSAGVKYNLGRALLEQGETERAAATLKLALDDCSNYAPAYRLLVACYEQLGENDKLAELKQMWDDDEDDDEDEPHEEEPMELKFDD
jgi:tetratricopeptide (TPR) repeat protein